MKLKVNHGIENDDFEFFKKLFHFSRIKLHIFSDKDILFQ